MQTLKIRWINPLGNPQFDHPIAELLQSIKRPETEIEVVSLTTDYPLSHLEYQTYEGLVVNGIVKVVRDAAQHHVDGVAIGCFYDTGLREAREISGETVVVAPCLASLQTVVNLAQMFSIIVGRKKWIHRMQSNIREYGYQHYLSSFRSIDMGVEELQRDPEVTQHALIEQAQRAVQEDGAEAIILGCTIEFGFYQELQRILGVPVIDVVVSTFKMCEHLASMKQQFFWRPSRAGSCEAPPQEELQTWGVFETKAPIGNRIEIR